MSESEFIMCKECEKLPNKAKLCGSCQNNRAIINNLKAGYKDIFEIKNRIVKDFDKYYEDINNALSEYAEYEKLGGYKHVIRSEVEIIEELIEKAHRVEESVEFENCKKKLLAIKSIIGL